MRQVRRFLYLTITGFALLLVYVLKFYHNDLHIPAVGVAKQKRKVILYWTTFFTFKDFDFGFGQAPYIRDRCKVTNCFATDDKSKAAEAAAIIIHMPNYDPNSMKLPSVRFPHQRYIFFIEETPYSLTYPLTPFNDVFNLTMTYRTDSDIKAPYGTFESRRFNDFSLTKDDLRQIYRRKVRPVAWFVSNCHTNIKRELYVKKLAEYIDVDIYGKCGPLNCPKATTEKCLQLLDDKYFFYLAFENNYCQDYLSEKMLWALKHSVIPVVMGNVNYTARAPPKSVINIQDFPNPKELAKHLKHLMQNEKEYLTYFEWKQKYYIKEGSNRFCDLCEIVNSPSYPTKVYANIDKFWGKETCDNAVLTRHGL